MLTSIVLTAGGLGLAGIDPSGAILGMGLFGAGAPRRNILLMVAIYLLGTIAIGVTLSIVFAGRIATLNITELEPPDWVDAIIFAVAGILLLAWGGLRVIHPAPPRTEDRRRGTGMKALALLGVVLAAGSLLSPPFIAMIVVAGKYHAIWAILLGHTIWTLINQSPLLLVTGVEMTGRGDRIVTAAHDWWIREQPAIARIFTTLLVLVSVALLLESAWWTVARDFLLI
ncbi:MAG TPA: hypothetical protein VFQ54_05355 [Thermomicrobiales bacterium]|nr:hypothetical protein [Thermomicrobiales bacterium]